MRLDSDLPVPAYAKDGDAGFDLRARVDFTLDAAGGRMKVPTGIAIAVPRGHAALVMPRSGLALRHGISIVNTPGLVDSGYRGEIEVLLINTDPAEAFEGARGDRIAQLVIIEVPAVGFEVVDSLDETERGAGGWGSSGRE